MSTQRLVPSVLPTLLRKSSRPRRTIGPAVAPAEVSVLTCASRHSRTAIHSWESTTGPTPACGPGRAISAEQKASARAAGVWRQADLRRVAGAWGAEHNMSGNRGTPGRSVASKVAAVLDAFTTGTPELSL